MQATQLCQYLDWDSDFFGVPIARLVTSRLNEESLALALAWCEAERIACLYFLSRADDDHSVRLVEANRFHLVDIRITLERSLSEQEPILEERADYESIRPATEDDMAALRVIAGVSHTDSRFYYDGNFPQSRCSALYETWIEKSFAGYADKVLVTELNGQAVGYISCHLPEAGVGQIGLVGVSAEAQGCGMGQQLIRAALYWFRTQGVKQITVVTQGRNGPAQRLYQRHGFRTQSVQLWYHRWF